MLTIKGIYDGTVIKPLEPIPFKEEVEVIITFLKEVEKTKARKNWRRLRGSATGEHLLEALLQDHKEELKREG